jgi:hypothetical protein
LQFLAKLSARLKILGPTDLQLLFRASGRLLALSPKTVTRRVFGPTLILHRIKSIPRRARSQHPSSELSKQFLATSKHLLRFVVR